MHENLPLEVRASWIEAQVAAAEGLQKISKYNEARAALLNASRLYLLKNFGHAFTCVHARRECFQCCWAHSYVVKAIRRDLLLQQHHRIPTKRFILRSNLISFPEPRNITSRHILVLYHASHLSILSFTARNKYIFHSFRCSCSNDHMNLGHECHGIENIFTCFSISL